MRATEAETEAPAGTKVAEMGGWGTGTVSVLRYRLVVP